MLVLILGVGFISFVAVVCSGAIVQYREKRKWNNGISVNSGQPWRPIGRAGRGKRYYTDGYGNYMQR